MRTEIVAIAIVAVAAVPARAAPDNADAKAAFVEGERDFQLGKFEAAIGAYERAFGLDPQPAFLFNIALAHRRQYEIDGKLEHLARARELYRNYLKLEPHGGNRAGVEKLIAELTARIDQARARVEAPPPPAAPPPPPPVAPAERTIAAAAPAPPPERATPVLVSAPASGDAEPPPHGSSRTWIIGGSIAAAAVVAALAIFFATRSEASFDGPGVNLTPGH
jgi:tetratricopeptide (TPR) repeat protein